MIQRIEDIKKHYKLSTRALAIRCGLNQPTLERMLKGENALNLKCVVSILRVFPEISAEWLLRGQGKMFSDEGTERVMSILDTMATLQESINVKDDIISGLNEKIRQLESQLKSK